MTTAQKPEFKDYVMENGLLSFSRMDRTNFSSNEERDFNQLLSKLNEIDVHSILNNPSETFVVYNATTEKYYIATQKFYGDRLNYTISLVGVTMMKPDTKLIIKKGIEGMRIKSRFEWANLAYSH